MLNPTAGTLRTMLNDEDLHLAPGVSDGLSTLLTRKTGFSLIYASGGAIARSSGRPDIGLLSLTEVVDKVAEIVEAAADIPVIADADTGFGNEINVQRTVRLFERAGAAGLHIEDQVFPKRCGHLEGKSLISIDEMMTKIKVACQSRSNPDTVIIARTDAIAVEGFNVAIERMQAYLHAGADMAFIEAPESLEQIEKIAELIKEPKLINMFYGAKTPLVPKDDLARMGYNIAIIPSDLQRASIKAMQKTLQTIYEEGDSKRVADDLISFKDREAIVETQKYFKLCSGETTKL